LEELGDTFAREVALGIRNEEQVGSDSHFQWLEGGVTSSLYRNPDHAVLFSPMKKKHWLLPGDA
jgi:hypothetical protein